MQAALKNFRPNDLVHRRTAEFLYSEPVFTHKLEGSEPGVPGSVYPAYLSKAYSTIFWKWGQVFCFQLSLFVQY